jgi:hypothetical protein
MNFPDRIKNIKRLCDVIELKNKNKLITELIHMVRALPVPTLVNGNFICIECGNVESMDTCDILCCECDRRLCLSCSNGKYCEMYDECIYCLDPTSEVKYIACSCLYCSSIA